MAYYSRIIKRVALIIIFYPTARYKGSRAGFGDASDLTGREAEKAALLMDEHPMQSAAASLILSRWCCIDRRTGRVIVVPAATALRLGYMPDS